MVMTVVKHDYKVVDSLRGGSAPGVLSVAHPSQVWPLAVTPLVEPISADQHERVPETSLSEIGLRKLCVEGKVGFF